MPTMMLILGVENEYIQYCEEKTNNMRCYYADRIKQLQPHSTVQHNQQKNTFRKQWGGTLSQPVKLQGRYVYNFETGKATRSGSIKKRTIWDSYSVEGSTMRYMPYDFVTDRKNKKLVLRTINSKV